MRHLIRLTDWNMSDIEQIFLLAKELEEGKIEKKLAGKSVIMFFPNSSIRTRVTYEKGIYLLGGQPILFPSETLNKKEALKDVCGYLNQWADAVIVRHKEIKVLEEMAKYLKVPVINAMTDINHPCEVLSDLYALSKIRSDYRKDKYVFCGEAGNIGLAWKEAAEVFGLDLVQCCAKGYEMDGVKAYAQIRDAAAGRDIICTDSLSSDLLPEFKDCQVTKEVMELATRGALLNPCPPFYRGEEVTEDVIESEYFVGYEFKKCLLTVQQAVLLYCLRK